MRLFQLLTFAYFLFFYATGISQQLTPFVVSTSGGFYSNASGMLSFTTGEMSSVETYSSPLTFLTQGFQQPWDLGTNIIEQPSPELSFGIYPNPSYGEFNLVTESVKNKNVIVKISDVMGREILLTEYYHQNKINIQHFDLSHAAQGIYLIAITVKDSNSSKLQRFFIQKIHILK